MSLYAAPFGDPSRGSFARLALRPGALLRAAAARLRAGAGTDEVPVVALPGPAHRVPSAEQLQAKVFAQLDRMPDGSFDEGNGYVFDEWILGVTRQWHVLVDLGHDEAEQTARAVVEAAENEVDRRARRVTTLREEQDRLAALLQRHEAPPPLGRPRARPQRGRPRGDRPAPDPAAPWGWDPPVDPHAAPPPTTEREEP